MNTLLDHALIPHIVIAARQIDLFLLNIESFKQ